jgi:hypothetical protein
MANRSVSLPRPKRVIIRNSRTRRRVVVTAIFAISGECSNGKRVRLTMILCKSLQLPVTFCRRGWRCSVSGRRMRSSQADQKASDINAN